MPTQLLAARDQTAHTGAPEDRHTPQKVTGERPAANGGTSTGDADNVNAERGDADQAHFCDLPSTCQPASTWGSEESKWSATIRSIAPTAICLTLGRRFERGTGLAIDLPSASGNGASTVLGKVVHVKPQPEGGWFLSCSLLSELNDDEIQRLLAAKPQRVVASPTTAARQSANAATPAAVDPPTGAEASASQAMGAQAALSQSASPTPSALNAPSQPAASPASPPSAAANRPEIKTYSQVHCRLEIQPGTAVQYIIQQLSVLESWPLPRGKVVTLRGSAAGGPWALKAQVLQCRFQDEIWYMHCRLLNFPPVGNLLGALARLEAGA